ncbi:MAG: leucyl aminopeptidase [Myxococcales bacterium]|nr:leucyl aminopeptidase [Myxococcales bacterium]
MDFAHLIEPALTAPVDLIAFVVHGDPTKDAQWKAFDAALHGALSAAAKSEGFEGKHSQSLTIWSASGIKAQRLLAIGAGPKSGEKLPAYRDIGAIAAQAGARVGAKSLAFLVPALGARLGAGIQMMVEGAVEGSYKFARYLTSEEAKRPNPLASFGFIIDGRGKKPTAAEAKQVRTALERGHTIARAVCKARDLVNEPAGYMTPTQLAAEATEIANRHPQLSVTVLSAKKCDELGMGMFLAVGRGSEQESKLIHLVYKPAKKAKKKIALIGKGVTFDSGGYSLKPSNAMEDMKIDMSGAAAVISAMDAIATLGSEHEIHAIAACCENLVSGRAYKLGDVLTSMDGTTVEINNTDAEGRLTLGDAITYARTKVEPDEMFDFATLTGACMVALGPYTAGVMSDHERLLKGWLAAAESTGEDMWRLPLNGRLREQLKSSVADMRNTGDRFGGAITAGLFLKVFAKDTPWVHVDLAGPASVSSGKPHQPRGGTGFAVATIVAYAAKS